MKFIDEATITAQAGKGGDGCVSFHRARFIPRGRPNGGDGGDGGSVYLIAKPNLNTLADLRSQHFFKAYAGGNGMGSDRTGKKGADLYIPVPPGTLIYDCYDGALICDLTAPEQTQLVARGGRGGLGNARFKSATNRSPTQSLPGEPGEERDLSLELKLLADVGLVGLPNAGKSTLLAAVSAAHPKIADYPFTTTAPLLGVVSPGGWQSFVMADLPGLIEGASAGIGLGARFLRHIQRTRLLLHVVDVGGGDVQAIAEAVRTVEAELRQSQERLDQYPRWLVLSKTDLLSSEVVAELKDDLVKSLRWTQPAFAVSAVARRGLQTLIQSVLNYLDDCPERS